MGNTNLHAAKVAKCDEFYTQLVDIENELKHYKGHFKDKVIFCNCDDPKHSNFVKYFEDNYDRLQLKGLLISYLKPDGTGDFRSDACIELLKVSDIVVTNGPFSLFREFVAQLVEYDKRFIIIGSQNAVSYKETFKLIKDDEIWLGYTSPKEFKQPDGSIKKFGNICWFTNIGIRKRHEDLILYKTYNPIDYPKYDNCDAINVDRVQDIPMNYSRDMGIPITYLNKHNPEQFEILHCSAYSDKNNYGIGALYVNGNKKYTRIIIRNKRLGET